MKPVPASRYVVFTLLAAGGLFWDLFSKHVVFEDLGYPGGNVQVQTAGRHEIFESPPNREGESVVYLTGWLKFQLFTNFNPGALWGIGQRWTGLFALLSIAAAAGVVYWLFFYGAARSLWLTIALALIMAGTLGNLWDRAGMHGCKLAGQPVFAVRDFLQFTLGTFNWPDFNFADVFLVSGASMLVLQSFFRHEGEDEPKTSAVRAEQ